MKRDDLVELILSYPKDTDFFIRGQGLAEGFPSKTIKAVEFGEFRYDDYFLDGRYGARCTDVVLEAH